MLRPVVMLIASLLSAAATHAQDHAVSFAELASRLKTGETVSVTVESGDVISGKVERVSDTGLTLNRPQREFAADDVRRVTRPIRFKRRGALVGVAVGFSFGGIVVLTADCSRAGFGPCFDDSAGFVVLGSVLGLWGAGIGTVVGALTHADRVLFSRAQNSSSTATIAPLLSRNRAGLRLQIRW